MPRKTKSSPAVTAFKRKVEAGDRLAHLVRMALPALKAGTEIDLRVLEEAAEDWSST